MRFLHPGNSSIQSGKFFLVMHSTRDARQFELSSIHSGVNRSDKKHGFSLSYVQFVIFRLTRWFILRVCNGRRGKIFFMPIPLRVFLTMVPERRSDRCHFCRRKISPRTNVLAGSWITWNVTRVSSFFEIRFDNASPLGK